MTSPALIDIRAGEYSWRLDPAMGQTNRRKSHIRSFDGESSQLYDEPERAAAANQVDLDRLTGSHACEMRANPATIKCK